MEITISWHMLAGAAIGYSGTLIFYRLFLDPLARFPGPKLAAVSRWYEAYYDVVLGGQYTAKIKELHKIYGLRVSNDTRMRLLSFGQVQSFESAHTNCMSLTQHFSKRFYRTDGRWHKYAWAYDAFGAPTSTLFGSDHDTHKARRRAIVPFFSKPNVLAREGTLRRNIDKLCNRISGLKGITFNLGAAISAFTRDNSNEFVFGKAYNELDLEDFGYGLSIASQGAGVFWRTTKHVRWFGPVLRAIPINWVMKMADEGTKSFLRFLQQAEADTRDTLAAAQSSHPAKNFKETMVNAIVYSDLPPSERTLERVFEEVATVTSAGYETTANVVRLILFHAYTNTMILQRLRKEIASITVQSTELPELKKLEQLPYLTAVLMEGMRLSPAIASRAARITDNDLFYDKWRIPAGIPVGMSTLFMHTDENLYPDPMNFNPDRWMNSTGLRGVAGSKFYAPFSRGTRICLEMHLAWAEMYLLLTALVQNFDFTIKDATAADFEMERDNFGIGTKAGCSLMAEIAPYKG